MEFNAVCTVKKEFSKEDFLRLLLIKLGINKETPMDVVNAAFGEVRESYREAILCTAYVEGDCTASVGYDRQEPYIVYEDYREKIGDTYVTRKRPVTKYKTVTDWHPYQTRFAGEATKAVYNDPERYGYDDDRIVEALQNIREDSIVLDGTAQVNSSGLKWAKEVCEIVVRTREVDFPGDHHKNAHYHTAVTVQRIDCYILPYYEVTYTYQGKEYTAGGFACGQMGLQAEYPPNDVDITELVQKKTRHLEDKEKKAWRLYTVSVILAFALCLLKFAWLWPVAVVLMVLAQRSSKDYREAYKACSDTYSKDIMQSKVQALKAELEKRGMEPLSDGLANSLESHTAAEAKEPKSVDNRIKGCWVLTVFLVIVSLMVGYSAHQEALHSVDNVKVTVVSKDERYETTAYGSSEYYVDLGYEIKSKKLGVERVELEVTVSERGGKEIGTITSSLQFLEIEKGKKETVNTYLAEKRPENNAFFTALYEAEQEELEFDVRIKMVQFDDGEYAYPKK